ncbi:MAG: hypothetical protein KBD63_03495 [Bacteriovoracaceae bacterium]|nr:hypothetical protein [Bacteriovoracaceae bacterium]
MSALKKPAYFCEGKIIASDLLIHLPPFKRRELLKNLSLQEPELALDLLSLCTKLDDFAILSDLEIREVVKYIHPAILGLALKKCNTETQLTVLTLTPKAYGEEAFEILTMPMAPLDPYLQKAEKKTLKLLLALHREGVISLF